MYPPLLWKKLARGLSPVGCICRVPLVVDRERELAFVPESFGIWHLTTHSQKLPDCVCRVSTKRDFLALIGSSGKKRKMIARCRLYRGQSRSHNLRKRPSGLFNYRIYVQQAVKYTFRLFGRYKDHDDGAASFNEAGHIIYSNCVDSNHLSGEAV